MKLNLFILLFLTCSYVYGQSYNALISEANIFYDNMEYDKSVSKYKEAFEISDKKGSDLYNAGCSASLAGDKKLAFKWLNLALENGWTNINHLKNDTDLTVLHDSKEWNELAVSMQKKLEAIEANYDKPLRAKLIAIFDDDQRIRRQYISAQNEFGHQSKEVDSLGRIMMFKDSINLIKVSEILDKDGWVGADQIGGQANHTLFLVIQHADLETQQKYLPMMRDAVKNNNASASALALLEDRVSLGEGKRQIYGSQIGTDNDTHMNYVLPLEDPKNVDIRRAEVGLGPLADYVIKWDIIWDVEAYIKLLPKIEALQAKRK